MTHSNFLGRFEELDALLLKWRWLWRQEPFKQPQLCWYRIYPQWRERLMALDDDAVQLLSADPAELHRFACEELGVCIPGHLTTVTALAFEQAGNDSRERVPDGIRPRKWAQISCFARALRSSDLSSDHHLVEWCAGKAHLSRGLLNAGLAHSAHALEHNAGLVHEGANAAGKLGLDISFHLQDVLDPDVARFCRPDSHHVALHACGDLHVNMLEQCSHSQVPRIDLVPCCYHLARGKSYQALSRPGQCSALELDNSALKLAVQETVTAPASAQRQRIRLQQWRLGFDCLVREVFGRENYLPLPSLSASEAGADFIDFCRRMADGKGITLPQAIDIDYFEQRGRERFRQVSREDLVRHLFRRPLELWLVYDRCLYLEENGYVVSLHEFCQRQLTPRNLWIHASRVASVDI